MWLLDLVAWNWTKVTYAASVEIPPAADGARMAIIQKDYAAYRFGGYSCTVCAC